MDGSMAEWAAVIVAIIAAFIVPWVGWIQRSINRNRNDVGNLTTEVAKLIVYREEHQRADDLAHEAFMKSSENLLQEIALMRSESAENFRRFEDKLEAATKEGNEGRKVLHVKIDEMKDGLADLNAKVERMDGFLEGRTESKAA